jgi:hypothetical protein
MVGAEAGRGAPATSQRRAERSGRALKEGEPTGVLGTRSTLSIHTMLNVARTNVVGRGLANSTLAHRTLLSMPTGHAGPRPATR